MIRYGDEIARLTEAHLTAKKGYDIARRNSVAPAVLQDIKASTKPMTSHSHFSDRAVPTVIAR